MRKKLYEANNEIRKKSHSGQLYIVEDPSFVKEQIHYLDDIRKFNKTHCSTLGLKKRQHMMKKMFAEIGEDCYIEPPVYSNFGFRNCHFGNHVYLNYNCQLVDDSDIYIGDDTMLAPNVIVCTATHPILPSLRKVQFEYNLPIHIGKDCWIGANTIILPGVTIGDNTVIGAGSLVTRDIPANVVAYGRPCKAQRPISEHDREFYYKDLKIPQEILDKYDK